MPEISPRKLKFALAIREYASLNSSPDTSIKINVKETGKYILKACFSQKHSLFAIKLVYAL